MSNCMYIPGQPNTCGQLRSVQMEMLGFGPNLLPDEPSANRVESAGGALKAGNEQSYDNLAAGPERQAIARLFAGVTRLQFDDLERLLAEGSKPNFS